MIDATGIASSFGKIANGSFSVMTTVESFGAASQETLFAFPFA